MEVFHVYFVRTLMMCLHTKCHMSGLTDSLVNRYQTESVCMHVSVSVYTRFALQPCC